jgi:hypothetical protein
LAEVEKAATTPNLTTTPNQRTKAFSEVHPLRLQNSNLCFKTLLGMKQASKKGRRSADDDNLNSSSPAPRIVEMSTGCWRLENITPALKGALKYETLDDPSLFFNWNHDALSAAVVAAVGFAGMLPTWWTAAGGVAAITSMVLQEQILAYCANGRPGVVVDQLCIAPNTLEQYGHCMHSCRHLCNDQFLVAICGAPGAFPLARLFFAIDGKRIATVQPCNVRPVPPIGWVQLFT